MADTPSTQAPAPAPQKTPLFDQHVQHGGKIVDFSGWALPIHFGSQLEEHHTVRTDAGFFDVSHMRITEVVGAGAKAWLQLILANDVSKLRLPGQGLYSAMLNESGGVIDDLIVYHLPEMGQSAHESHYLIVSNAATDAKVQAHFNQTLLPNVELKPRTDLAMLAIQGPRALEKLALARPEWTNPLAELKRFHLAAVSGAMIARTGYTGEDGVEVMLSSAQAQTLYAQLVKAGIQPIGLGARDTLRLEAGLNLYGQDMDETVSPLAANLAWTVSLKDESRDFMGKAALLKQQQADLAGTGFKQVGLVLKTRGVLRHDMEVVTDFGSGVVTSGSFSPTLGHSIAIARVPIATELGDNEAASGDGTFVSMRGKLVPVTVVNLPFVKGGEPTFN